MQGRRVVIADVPYGGGTSRDGKTVYIDRRIPRFLDVDGKQVDVHKLIAEHEIAEYAAMAKGESYADAHNKALHTENDDAESEGIKHADYERIIKPYVDEAMRAAKPDGIPSDLNEQPYRDMKQENLLAGRPTEPEEGMEQGGEAGPRGRYFKVQRLIELTKIQDRTTFLHELGHWGLEFMDRMASRGDAPASFVADMANIRTWLGAEEGQPFTW